MAPEKSGRATHVLASRARREGLPTSGSMVVFYPRSRVEPCGPTSLTHSDTEVHVLEVEKVSRVETADCLEGSASHDETRGNDPRNFGGRVTKELSLWTPACAPRDQLEWGRDLSSRILQRSIGQIESRADYTDIRVAEKLSEPAWNGPIGDSDVWVEQSKVIAERLSGADIRRRSKPGILALLDQQSSMLSGHRGGAID